MMPEWHNAQDKLPEYFTPVIGEYRFEAALNPTWHVNVVIFVEDANRDYWCLDSYENSNEHKEVSVRRWTEMPKPVDI